MFEKYFQRRNEKKIIRDYIKRLDETRQFLENKGDFFDPQMTYACEISFLDKCKNNDGLSQKLMEARKEFNEKQ